jgi:hypothetical protein
MEVIFDVFNHQKWWKKERGKNHDKFIFGFLVCSLKYWRLKICTSYLVYSQIWLNLFMDDHHFFYIFLWMITTLAIDHPLWGRILLLFHLACTVCWWVLEEDISNYFLEVSKCTDKQVLCHNSYLKSHKFGIPKYARKMEARKACKHGHFKGWMNFPGMRHGYYSFNIRLNSLGATGCVVVASQGWYPRASYIINTHSLGLGFRSIWVLY